MAWKTMAAIGAALAWRAGGPTIGSDAPDWTSPARLTVLAYLLFHAAGSLLLLTTSASVGAGPLLAGGAIMAFGVGAFIARQLLGPDRRWPAPIKSGFDTRGTAVLAAVGLVAVGVLIAEHGLPLLERDPQASRAGFAGPLFDAFRWLAPPAAVLVFARSWTHGDRRDRIVGLAGLAAVAGLEILLGSRALPFELAAAALLVAWWAGRRPGARVWVALGALGVVVFVGVLLVRAGPDGGYRGPAEAAAFAARRTIDRVILIHPRTLELVASEIPTREPYFGGSTYVRRLSVLLGAPERPSLGYWLYERLFPGETGGFAAPGVAGEAWANGGPIWTGLLMGALGALAIWLGRILSRLPGGPADRVFAALVTVALARTYATSLNGFLLTLLAAAAWWLVASGRLRTGRARARASFARM